MYTIFILILQTLFTRALSRRIRHIRYVQKKKSAPPAPPLDVQNGSPRVEAPKTPLKRKRESSSTNSPSKERGAVPHEEYRGHLRKLSAEMTKRKPDEKHIKTILDAVHTNNQNWFSTLADGELAPIIKVLSCYEMGTYVSVFIAGIDMELSML